MKENSSNFEPEALEICSQQIDTREKLRKVNHLQYLKSGWSNINEAYLFFEIVAIQWRRVGFLGNGCRNVI